MLTVIGACGRDRVIVVNVANRACDELNPTVNENVVNGVHDEQGLASFTHQVLKHRMKYILCQNLL